MSLGNTSKMTSGNIFLGLVISLTSGGYPCQVYPDCTHTGYLLQRSQLLYVNRMVGKVSFLLLSDLSYVSEQSLVISLTSQPVEAPSVRFVLRLVAHKGGTQHQLA